MKTPERVAESILLQSGPVGAAPDEVCDSNPTPKEKSPLKYIVWSIAQYIAGGIVTGILFVFIGRPVVIVPIVIMIIWPKAKMYSLGGLVSFSAWLEEYLWVPLLVISVLVVVQEILTGRK